MKQTLKKPCKECPFRRTSLKGYTGPYASPEELVDLVLADVEPFPCHMSMGDEDEDRDTENEEHCVGALSFFANQHKLSRDRSRPRGTPDPEVFRFRHEFIEYHTLKRKPT